MSLSLDLDPEFGDVDLIKELQEIFEIELTQGDVGHWRTLGDVHETITALAPFDASGDGACPTAMTFHRLRRALAADGQEGSIRPSTALIGITGNHPAKLLGSLGSKSGLQMPVLSATWVGTLGVILLVVGAVALSVAAVQLDPKAALTGSFSLIAALVLFRLDPCRLGTGLQTVGDLSRMVCALNRPILRKQGATFRPDSSWEVITRIAANLSGRRANDMSAGTYLFDKSLHEAAKRETA